MQTVISLFILLSASAVVLHARLDGDWLAKDLPEGTEALARSGSIEITSGTKSVNVGVSIYKQ